jgi:hypothetical protein
MPGPNASRCSSGPTATMLAAATLLGRRTNRTIMQIGPTARHSPIGLFQRVCYLVHVVGDSWVAAARRRNHQHPVLLGVALDREATEVTVARRGVGVCPEGLNL